MLRSYVRHWATQSEHQLQISFIPERRNLPSQLKKSAIPGYIVQIALNGHAIGEPLLCRIIVGDLHETHGVKYSAENVKAALAGFIWDAFQRENLPAFNLDDGPEREKCIVPDCELPAKARGLCKLHYDRHYHRIVKDAKKNVRRDAEGHYSRLPDDEVIVKGDTTP